MHRDRADLARPPSPIGTYTGDLGATRRERGLGGVRSDSTAPDRAGVRRHKRSAWASDNRDPSDRSWVSGIAGYTTGFRSAALLSGPTAGTDVCYAVRTSPSTLISVRFG